MAKSRKKAAPARKAMKKRTGAKKKAAKKSTRRAAPKGAKNKKKAPARKKAAARAKKPAAKSKAAPKRTRSASPSLPRTLQRPDRLVPSPRSPEPMPAPVQTDTPVQADDVRLSPWFDRQLPIEGSEE